MISEIISKYLSNEASEQEVAQLFEWIEASEENKKQFITLKKTWALTALSGTISREVPVVALKPKNLTMDEAGSIPLVGLTAWQALVEIGKVKKGQKVFIQAGSGGVGTFAIQLAKHLGAFVATTTSASNFELVKSLGADLIIDYKTQDFVEEVKKATDGKGVATDATHGDSLIAVLHTVGGYTTADAVGRSRTRQDRDGTAGGRDQRGLVWVAPRRSPPAAAGSQKGCQQGTQAVAG